MGFGKIAVAFAFALACAGAFAEEAKCVSDWNVEGDFPGADKIEKHGDSVWLVWNKPDKRPIWFGGRSRSVDAGLGGDYCVFLDIQYDDGSWAWAVRTDFPRGTHDWLVREEVFHPAKPVAKVQVYLFLRKTTGEAHFDGAFLKREMPPDGRMLWDRRFTLQPFRAADRLEGKVIRGGKPVWETRDDAARIKVDCPLAAGTKAVWVADSMRRVSPLDFPKASETVHPRFGLELARGECESVQVCVSAAADVAPQPFKVAVSPAKLADGTAFAGEVKVNRIGYLPRRDRYHPHSFGPPETHLWFAEPLLPMESAETVAGGTQGAWLTFKADRSARAGTYAGTVKVDVGGTVTELPYRLRVRDFALPERFGMKASYSVMDGFTRAKYPDDFKAKKRESWDIMLDHRLSPDDISRTTPPDLDDVAYALKRGMNFFNVLNLVPPPTNKNALWVCIAEPDAVFNEPFYDYLKKTLTPYVAELRKRGFDKYAYIYGFDEREKKYYDKLLPLWKRLKEDFGLPVMTTAMMFRDVTKKELSVDSPLATMTDIHVPLESVYDVAIADKYRALGREVWWYTCCAPTEPWCNNASYEYPLIECRVLAWILRLTRADGYLFWHVNFWPNGKLDETAAFQPDWNSYSDLGMPGDGIFLYPGKRHIVPGIRLANVRDGEEDYEWAQLAEARAGREAVEKVLREVATSGKAFSRDPDILRRARTKLADLIEK